MNYYYEVLKIIGILVHFLCLGLILLTFVLVIDGTNKRSYGTCLNSNGLLFYRHAQTLKSYLFFVLVTLNIN